MGRESSTEIRLTAREHALVAGGGAGTLPIEEWEQLLQQVATRGAEVESRWRTVRLGFQLSLGAVVVSAGGHLVPVLADAFRIILFVAVFLVISLAGAMLLMRGQRVTSRIGALDLPLVRELRRALPGAPLYLGITTRGQVGAQPVLSGALTLDDKHVLVFAVGATPSGTVVEAGLGTRRGHATAQSPSVSGMTRARADEAAAEGNPFTSLEMVVLKEAHKLQRRWASVERFATREEPMPTVEDVLAEHTVRESVPPERLAVSSVMNALQHVAREGGRPL